MKSLRFSILSGVAVAVCLALALLVYDYVSRSGIEREAQNTLNEITLPLLETANPTLLFGQLDEGVELISPNMTFITRFLPLITLDPWEGQIDVPSYFSDGTPNAQLETLAYYSRGTATIRAALVYRRGQWLIRQYEVIEGPSAQ